MGFRAHNLGFMVSVGADLHALCDRNMHAPHFHPRRLRLEDSWDQPAGRVTTRSSVPAGCSDLRAALPVQSARLRQGARRSRASACCLAVCGYGGEDEERDSYSLRKPRCLGGDKGSSVCERELKGRRWEDEEKEGQEQGVGRDPRHHRLVREVF